jgi:hypothetical protein
MIKPPYSWNTLLSNGLNNFLTISYLTSKIKYLFYEIKLFDNFCIQIFVLNILFFSICVAISEKTRSVMNELE